MRINADFSRRALVAPHQQQWVASPQAGVERVMLDRVGAEKARATSIVRYAPASDFPRHPHPGGEEILVLSGTFSDEDGDFPAGWYLRNPPGSGHAPRSREGALIFVKLWQMPTDERHSVRIDTRNADNWRSVDGRETCALFSAGYEQVSLLRLRAGEAVFAAPVEGAEVLVIDGAVTLDEQSHEAGAWMRFPAGELPALAADGEGATIYLKTGHLADPALLP